MTADERDTKHSDYKRHSRDHGYAYAHDQTHAHDDHDHSYPHGHGHAHHDWHSQAYVDYWIARDADREEQRRPRIREMVAIAPLPRDAAIQVLDIGAGYGFVTEEVLHVFPNARVTLQDYSDLMLAHARARLAKATDQITCLLCDLTDRGWTERLGGPFDLIVSAIAIHNLRSTDAIAACYRGIARLLKPGAPFLDYDLFRKFGGIESHISLMQEAGMTRVSRAWDEEDTAIIVGYGRRAG
jgi:SAM-dependent methyltransferase